VVELAAEDAEAGGTVVRDPGLVVAIDEPDPDVASRKKRSCDTARAPSPPRATCSNGTPGCSTNDDMIRSTGLFDTVVRAPQKSSAVAFA